MQIERDRAHRTFRLYAGEWLFQALSMILEIDTHASVEVRVTYRWGSRPRVRICLGVSMDLLLCMPIGVRAFC